MEDGQHDFQSRFVLLFMHPGRNASSVILYSDGIVFIDGHFDIRTEPCQGFIDTVVHYLINQVMQTSLPYVSDIHGRPFPHGFKTFQNLDTAGGILLFRTILHFVFTHFSEQINFSPDPAVRPCI